MKKEILEIGNRAIDLSKFNNEAKWEIKRLAKSYEELNEWAEYHKELSRYGLSMVYHSNRAIENMELGLKQLEQIEGIINDDKSYVNSTWSMLGDIYRKVVRSQNYFGFLGAWFLYLAYSHAIDSNTFPFWLVVFNVLTSALFFRQAYNIRRQRKVVA